MSKTPSSEQLTMPVCLRARLLLIIVTKIPTILLQSPQEDKLYILSEKTTKDYTDLFKRLRGKSLDMLSIMRRAI